MIVLVAERFNQPRWDDEGGWESRARTAPRDWWRMSFALRAFRLGNGEARLRSLGLDWGRSMNLLPPSPVVGEWDAAWARAIVHANADRFEMATGIICVGRRVARAFGMGCMALGAGDGRYFVAPHPSGRNRWWNGPGNVDALRLAAAQWHEKIPQEQP